MKKTIGLGLCLAGILAAKAAYAQLPANPWDTAAFDAALSDSQAGQAVAKATSSTTTVQETAGADVAHITKGDTRVYVPSIKYKAINADATDPVYVPVIDSQGNAKTGVTVKNDFPGTTKRQTDKVAAPLRTTSATRAAAAADGSSWRGSGQFEKLGYTGEVTTYGTAYGQEMLAPEVNNHNIKVMMQHLRNLGYEIPESYDTKFVDFTQNYADELRQSYNSLGSQNNPFDTMFAGMLDVFENQTGLNMENILFNSIDLISRD